MERRRRDWRAGKPHHASSNSASNQPKFTSNAHRNRVNYDTTSSTAELRTQDSQDSSNLTFMIGTCPDMCPGRERAQRERLRDLSVFERLNGNPGRTSSALAVKKFCRTMCTMDVQASDIRPLPVLQDTLKYLFSLLESSQFPFEVVHDFVFDRTRSIRQDLGMQNIISDQAIGMYEEMVKFHIISHHKLTCSDDPNISSLHYLNMEQLIKTLVFLFDLYAINRRSNSINKNENEFYSFYVLMHLGVKGHPMGESLALWFRKLPHTVKNSKEMHFARTLLRCFRIGNYKCFFNTLAAVATYLQFCVIAPFINEVRMVALSYINHGNYKIHPYPLAHLSELLMMKESELESLCNMCGLQTNTDEVGIKLLCTKQTSFCLPRGGFHNYSFSGFERFQREAEVKDNGTLGRSC